MQTVLMKAREWMYKHATSEQQIEGSKPESQDVGAGTSYIFLYSMSAYVFFWNSTLRERLMMAAFMVWSSMSDTQS